MAEQQTCGKGLAEHSALPAMLGDLIASMAEVLEVHTRALDLEDPDARKENQAYVELIMDHRQIAAQLRAAARQMATYRDLPMGKHDASAMSGREPLEVFEKFVKVEQELLAMLQKWVERDQKMLAGWNATP